MVAAVHAWGPILGRAPGVRRVRHKAQHESGHGFHRVNGEECSRDLMTI
jgi:hypothetical protein